MAKKELKKVNKVIKANLKSHGKTGKAFKKIKHVHGKNCTTKCLLGKGKFDKVDLGIILLGFLIMGLVLFIG